MSIEFPLDPRFRLVHEPLRSGEHAWLTVGDQDVAAALAQRLQYSDGGSFLITGFRGVGKTTAAHEAVRLYAEAIDREVIVVELSLAQAPQRDQLLFEIVRRLYEALSDRGVLDRLTPEVRDVVSLAYARTSLAMKESRSHSEEHQQQLGVGGNVTVGSGRSAVRIPGPKLSFTRKRSSGRAVELSFLTYSDFDAEHDLRRILKSLRDPRAERRNLWYRALSKLRLAHAAQPLTARVVVVFDEIDKLTQQEGGLGAFETLLRSLKNLLASSGVHFIVVGGVDLHDEWLRDASGPNSLYRSVFAWHIYTPCTWQEAGGLVHRLGAGSDRTEDGDQLLAKYLEFSARGVLRALVFELNGMAVWRDGHPFLVIDDGDLERSRLAADLQTWLAELMREDAVTHLLASAVEEDRARLAMYYAVDWILRSSGVQFRADDLIAGDRLSPIDPILRPSHRVIENLVDHLVAKGFLSVHDPLALTATRVGPAPEGKAAEKLYWLSSEAQARLRLVAQSSDRGREQVRAPAEDDRLPAPGGERIPPALREALISRYRLDQLIGVGGLSSVWSGTAPDGTRVAIKIMKRHDGAPLEMPLPREVEHDNIARTIEVIERDGETAQVMQFIDGQALAAISRPVPPASAVAIWDRLLDAVAYLHRHGWARFDIKPHNIVMRGAVDPVMIDLGLAVRAGEDRTGKASFVGTPAFVAPEAFSGESVDIRADLYSLTVTVAEILGGQLTRRATFDPNAPAIRDLDGLPVSEALRGVVERGLAWDRDDRYASPEEMRAALRTTPEWRAAGEGRAPSLQRS